MKTFKVSNGMIVAVDDEDFELISEYKWSANPSNQWSIGCGNVKIHRLVMGAEEYFTVVDHINGNPLDNRKINLRFATSSQNSASQRKKFTEQYRGIKTKIVRGQAFYFGQIWNRDRQYRTPLFETPDAAMRAYDVLTIEKRGDFSFRHFPNGYEQLLPKHLIDYYSSLKTSPIPYPSEYF
jgi:hypothetical protein